MQNYSRFSTIPEMKAPTNTGEDLQAQFVKQILTHLKDSKTKDQEMCAKAEVSPQHWSNIKSLLKGLTIDMLARIATACGKKVTITLQ